MPPEDRARLIWTVLTLIGALILLAGVMLALMASWRNHGKRERLLEQGRNLRAAQHPHRPVETPDAWREAGRRYQDKPGDHGSPPPDADAEPDGGDTDDDAPPGGSHGRR